MYCMLPVSKSKCLLESVAEECHWAVHREVSPNLALCFRSGTAPCSVGTEKPCLCSLDDASKKAHCPCHKEILPWVQRVLTPSSISIRIGLRPSALQGHRNGCLWPWAAPSWHPEMFGVGKWTPRLVSSVLIFVSFFCVQAKRLIFSWVKLILEVQGYFLSLSMNHG